MDILFSGQDGPNDIALPGSGAPDESERILLNNLRALSRSCPGAVRAIIDAEPHPGVDLFEADDGGVTGTIEETGDIAEWDDDGFGSDDDPLGLGLGKSTTRSLGSKRRPLAEAKRLADSVDLVNHGGIAVTGFGLGHHVGAIATKLLKSGVILCFEPDVRLLRSVLSRVDHSAWIEKTNLVILSDGDDRAAMSAGLSGGEGTLALGFKFVDHPPSAPRLGDAAGVFCKNLTQVLQATRTTLITTLVQVETTMRNLLMNADRYVLAPGIQDLAGAASGKPAIVVSAGPSLARNLDLLKDPSVRDRFVIIAVQTVLKPMLAKGIKPHFVCALDHHELSRRFYEGLTERDVEGVTLVLEAKCNPAITQAWPGRVRFLEDRRLNQALGERLGVAKGRCQEGATVAHLCYYLARHLATDPVVLIGQDLGFTDGQYYAAGAAIHDVWSGELNPFRSLEMFEWERIARERNLLHEATDQLGRRIYSDEQMRTYLAQFEKDFAEDRARGLTVVDATEGGVAKRDTRIMPLAEAIAAFGSGDSIMLPATPDELSGEAREARLDELAAQMAAVHADARTIAKKSREAGRILSKMLGVLDKPEKFNSLVHKAHAIRDEVQWLQPAYELTQFLNQTGTLNRFRADRAMQMEKIDNPTERQRRQVERDKKNVEWLADAADALADLFARAERVARGTGERMTRDMTDGERDRKAQGAAVSVSKSSGRAGVVVFVDPEIGGLGTPRDLSAKLATGENTLRMTARRLLRSRRAKPIVFAGADAGRIGALLGQDVLSDKRVRVETIDGERLRDRTIAVGKSRVWAPASWRGSLGGLTCYDEACDFGLLDEVMDRASLTSAVIVGADWPLVDPDLIDGLIERSAQGGGKSSLAICQAVPGLGGLLIDRETVSRLAEAATSAGAFASFGGVLGYVPTAPQSDPIAKGFCVGIDPIVRDLGRRVAADAPPRVGFINAALGRLGSAWLDADAASVCRAIEDAGPQHDGPPQQVTIELCTGRLSSGLWARRLRGDLDERPAMETGVAERLISQAAASRPDVAISFAGLGDPCLHPDLDRLVAHARSSGAAAVHVRTDALAEGVSAERLLSMNADVVSVDMLAAKPETYRVVGGSDRYDSLKSLIETMTRGRTIRSCGLPETWVVPRMTRCDEVYEELEVFYTGWLLVTGACVIDPALPDVSNQRIAPLPIPRTARTRFARTTLDVRSDGTILGPDGEVIADVTREDPAQAWRRLRRAERESRALVTAIPGAPVTPAAA